MSPPTKADYRKAWREAHPDSSERHHASQSVCHWIRDSIEFQRARFVTIYSPRAWEIDLTPLWAIAPLKVVFPRALPKLKTMHFHLVATLDELTQGFAGIREPKADEATRVDAGETSDLILVPGVRFDLSGGRIGTGGGYYDRFLDGKSTTKWGVCFSTQLSHEMLAQEPTDVRMDGIVTELGLTRIKRP